jgi:hypothetical protein
MPKPSTIDLNENDQATHGEGSSLDSGSHIHLASGERPGSRLVHRSPQLHRETSHHEKSAPRHPDDSSRERVRALQSETPEDLDSFFATRAQDISLAWVETEEAVRSSIRRVIVFGLLLLDTKERGLQTKVIKHGQFLPWLEKNCPAVPQRTAYQWMALASGVMKSLQICNDCKFDDLPLHQVLQLPSNQLPKEAADLQQKVFNLVDGKSQKQLLFEFRDDHSDPTPTGGFRPNRDELNDWLAKHGHEGLVGKPFTKLPAKVQEAFHKSRAGKPKPVDPKKELRQRYALVIEQAHETIAKLELFTDEALTELGEAGAELGKEIPEFKTIVSDLLASSTRMNVRIRDLTKGKSK